MALNENMIPFLYPVVQAVFDKECEGIFFGPNSFVYPIVDAALRGQYVNGVPVFGPDGHANIICHIGDATVEFIQHCVESYSEDEEQKSFLVRVCQDAASFIFDIRLKIVRPPVATRISIGVQSKILAAFDPESVVRLVVAHTLEVYLGISTAVQGHPAPSRNEGSLERTGLKQLFVLFCN